MGTSGWQVICSPLTLYSRQPPIHVVRLIAATSLLQVSAAQGVKEVKLHCICI